MHICFRHTGHPVEVVNHEWKWCHLRHFRYIFFTKWQVLTVPLKRHSGTTLWRKRVPNWNYSLRCSVNDRVKWSRENDRISRVIRVRFSREQMFLWPRRMTWILTCFLANHNNISTAHTIYIKVTFLISTVNATHAVVSNCHLEHCIIKYFGKKDKRIIKNEAFLYVDATNESSRCSIDWCTYSWWQRKGTNHSARKSTFLPRVVSN